MRYSIESSLIMTSIFYGVMIIGVLILSKYKQNDEKKITLKLIGYIFLSAFKFSINKISLPIGFVIAYFLKEKTNKNKGIKTRAMFIGGTFFILGLFPLQNRIEELIYPRDEINTYLLSSEERTGYNITISDINGKILGSIFENSEQGVKFYEELLNLSKLDRVKLIDWKYHMILAQDNEDERFNRLDFKISDDIKYISLEYEGKNHIFNTSEGFRKIFKKLFNK